MRCGGPLLPEFTAHRQVIGVDLHGHGRTELGERKIRLVDMGDDLAVLLAELGYDKVDVLGCSMGAGAAFRLAVQHPEAVRRFVLASAPFARDGFFPEMLPQQAQVGAGMVEAMKDTPMYQSYKVIAPHPEDFPKLLDLTHYEMFMAPQLADTVLPFLDGKSGMKSWAGQVAE